MRVKKGSFLLCLIGTAALAVLLFIFLLNPEKFNLENSMNSLETEYVEIVNIKECQETESQASLMNNGEPLTEAFEDVEPVITGE